MGQRVKSPVLEAAVWIGSKSPSVGGRKIRRGVTIGIKWCIERLRWNCSGRVKRKGHCLPRVPYALSSIVTVSPILGYSFPQT